jgi:hypothetical protein
MRLFFVTGLVLLAAMPSAAAVASSQAAEPFVASRNPEAHERSLECLSQAIYYEARSQSDDGQRAVAQVVLNRVRHPAFPNSVCGVVYQGSGRSTGCQFTFTCDGSITNWIEPHAWERARRIAEAALGGSVYRPVGLATNYHTTAIHPYWAPSLTPQTIVGSHIFYRRPGSETLDAFSQSPAEDEPDIAAPQLRHAVAWPTMHRAFERYESRPVLEIPVVEQAVIFRTVGQRPAASNRVRAPQARQAVIRSEPRVVIQSGVRVFRGH